MKEKPIKPLTEKQKQLVADNHNLIYEFLHQQGMHTSEEIAEHYDLCAIALCKAARRFDTSKGFTFSTFAFICMKNEMKRQFEYQGRSNRIPTGMLCSYEAEILLTSDGDNKSKSLADMLSSDDDLQENVATLCIFEEALTKLSSTERRTLALLSDGYTQREAAEMIGVSQATVSRAYLHFRRLLSA